MALKNTSRVGYTGEGSLLQAIKRVQLGRHIREAAVRVGIGDDAAAWQPRAGYETILTCDWFLEDTHFLVDRHPPQSIGWKCLARATSDIAAMGAEPRCFLLSLALPKASEGEWLRGFLDGLRSASRSLQCPIAGGDTTRRREILINITVLGECRRNRAILRSGAHPGDAIFVTGRLGEAEYGLRLLKNSARPGDPRLRKQLYPVPRLEVGRWLADRKVASAMMDLSDGLSTDLPRLCVASGVGARLEQRLLPVVKLNASDRKKFDWTELAMHGGDDYELLFTVPQRYLSRIPRRIAETAITRIGITTAETQVLVDASGEIKELVNRGWDPFR